MMPGEICDCTNDSEEDAAKVISTALLVMLGIGLAGVRVRREDTIIDSSDDDSRDLFPSDSLAAVTTNRRSLSLEITLILVQSRKKATKLLSCNTT